MLAVEFLVDSFSLSPQPYDLSKKSVVNPAVVPLYVLSCFSLAVFKIFGLSLALSSLTLIDPGIDIFGFIILKFIEIWGSADCFPSKLGKFLT